MPRGSVITDDELDLDEEELDDELDLEDDEDSEEDEDDSETEQPQATTGNTQTIELSRFQGLQGSLQQSREREQMLTAQLILLTGQVKRNELIAAGVDPAIADEQIKSLIAAEIVKMEGANIGTQRQALEETSRVLLARQLAQEHNIALDSPQFDRMMKFKDPEDMTAYAEAIVQRAATQEKTKEKAKRQKRGADRFGSARPVGRPPKEKAKSLGDAMDRFVGRRISS